MKQVEEALGIQKESEQKCGEREEGTEKSNQTGEGANSSGGVTLARLDRQTDTPTEV